MTVVTPGGPCLTQTQIFRDEQLARFKEKSDAKAGAGAGAANPYAGVAIQKPQTATAVTAPEKTGTDGTTQKSYGAPGGGLVVDITV